MNPARKLLTIASIASLGLSIASGVSAQTTETVEVGVEFVEPIAITENVRLNFGFIDVAFSNTDTMTIAPDSSLTDPGLLKVGGGAATAANLTVDATAGQQMDVFVDNVTDGADYDLSAFLCSYDGGADTTCDGPALTVTSVATATLLIGATIDGTGAGATAGNQDGSFDVTISYQ
jgi:hypothetical protein